MSQKRARLRALASLGLSIFILGALVPVAAAASTEGSIDLSPQPRSLVGNQTAATAIAPASALASSRVIALAETHLGARYQRGATGPRTFDCSGLVYRVFEDAGLGSRIAGLRSAYALYAHFRALRMTSTRNPLPGDLVIFGGGSHVGIYIGAGRVIHAMVSGVAITRITAVYPGFTTYVHLGLSTARLSTTTAVRPTPHGRGRGPRVLSTVHTTVALSLRLAPSTGARRLLVLRPGDRLAVIGTSRGLHNLRWLRVIAPGGQIGWVVAGYTR